MTWAPTETQIAVYGALSGDSALQTLLGGAGRILNHVPDQTTFPYITFSLLPFTIRDNYTKDGLENFKFRRGYKAQDEAIKRYS
jgi:hypothetical protein